MLEICLLGSGGTMPLPNRALTALWARHNGSALLIDCGEGTQLAFREKGLSLKPVDAILFTHFHADHIAGLPGFLLTMGKQGRTEPVKIIGPQGVSRYVKSLCVIAPELPFPVDITEISADEQSFSLCGLKAEAFRADHGVPCYGYSLMLDRAPRFDPEKARSLGVQQNLWRTLQSGSSVVANGKTVEPRDVLGEPRKGLKAVYVTDTRPTENIAAHAKNADLFICEGTYGSEDKLPKALEHKHMLFREAAELAKTANVRELWLTHYSPSINDPREFIGNASDIFPNSRAFDNGNYIDLKFEDQK